MRDEGTRFVSRIAPPLAEGDARSGPAYWFIFQGDRLLVYPEGGEGGAVPLAESMAWLGIAPLSPGGPHYLGYLEDAFREPIDCYGAEIGPDASLPEGMIADGLRALYPRLGDVLFGLAGRAIQIVAWDRTHQYCGQCGAPTVAMEQERARRCPKCDLMSYPRLSPAIIIAVVRHTEQGDRILLARNHRFPPGRYSVVAGYVEPGESLEECAHREVAEEVGILISDVRYFGSQPWPFPNSLMIGFTAHYAGGEITLEESEIADARWFAADALPGLPPPMTIARRLIDWFRDEG